MISKKPCESNSQSRSRGGLFSATVKRREKSSMLEQQSLLTEAEVNEAVDQALNISRTDPWKAYRKSSREIPRHKETRQKRYLAYDQTDQSLWMVTKVGDSKQTLAYEFGALALCKEHQNFVKYRETFLSNGAFYAVTEVPEGMAFSLETLIKKINRVHRISQKSTDRSSVSETAEPTETKGSENGSSDRLTQSSFQEDLVLYILHEVLQALAYLHSKNIIHRDLVPGNITVGREGAIKISDSLLARFLTVENPAARKVKGKVHYLSPEAMRGWEYTQISDMWSFGILTLKVAENRVPFSKIAEPGAVMMAVVTNRAPELSRDTSWSSEFRKMNDSCLQHNIHERSTSSKLLKHKCWQKKAPKEDFQAFIYEFFQK